MSGLGVLINLENINIQKILLDYDVEDYIFLIISKFTEIASFLFFLHRGAPTSAAKGIIN